MYKMQYNFGKDFQETKSPISPILGVQYSLSFKDIETILESTHGHKTELFIKDQEFNVVSDHKEVIKYIGQFHVGWLTV